MEKREIILAIVIIAFLAARLYKKYISKGKDLTKKSDSFSTSGDDDYEPYSGK